MTVPLGFDVWREPCATDEERTGAYYTIGLAQERETMTQGRRQALVGRLQRRSRRHR
jgi:hypothetical protein